ncbi:protein phosphatase 1 regulatory inhibitor subunit 16B-like isoform X1 [Conger conger]|uniref:protein phosphatase 1 regulatory inhibitor subunit 16B-like isoform X1 n=1 Tax=Conger conger TaxID=82655 RepID=UPI002A5AAA21|nr:protein phosphatase 1 regulatory inhibitor subunit 16B-like isoform X1 [Conger conger]XP_061076544.1 protein phosphatase 1 regulatory inhibitor subunit 16B-like isoform X1 [Conger conger]XP_061076546.1 protein phosphatase 1 regulatory inhibitor subunit 16B-like isoform X1 [Conger conger]
MANHVELLNELQQLEKVPSLERLRAAQRRRSQQLKRWALYEKEMQSRKRKAEKRRGGLPPPSALDGRKRVSFSASVALLEASARNDSEEVSIDPSPAFTEHTQGFESPGAALAWCF